MRHEPVRCLCLGKKQYSGFGHSCGKVIYRLAVRRKWGLLSHAVCARSSLLALGAGESPYSSKGTNPQILSALIPVHVCVAGSAPPEADHFLKTPLYKPVC